MQPADACCITYKIDGPWIEPPALAVSSELCACSQDRALRRNAGAVRRSMEIIATRNASLAAELREALKQHSLKDSPSSKDTPLSEAAAAADADEDADDVDDEDMDDETDEEKGVQ